MSEPSEGPGGGGAQMPDAAVLADTLLRWYATYGRRLAIRDTTDPYAILVAEVMAQQTQISRVEPAWRAFLARFPTVGSLATSSPADVIRAWAGLGYNGRAVRLRRAAVAIVERHRGRVPDSVDELVKLPGIGPYTARAVTATAFGRREAAVDTNVRRVLGRVTTGHGNARDAGRPLPAGRLQAIADALVPDGMAAPWTHALMDLGATVCRPAPRCTACPVASLCTYAVRCSPTPPTVARFERRRTRVPFPATSRWLRGRLLAYVRHAVDAGWTRVPDRLGSHDRAAVNAACAALAQDGLIEWDGRHLARLPREDGDDGAPVRPCAPA